MSKSKFMDERTHSTVIILIDRKEKILTVAFGKKCLQYKLEMLVCLTHTLIGQLLKKRSYGGVKKIFS